MNYIKSYLKKKVINTVNDILKSKNFKYNEFPKLDQAVIEINNLKELIKLFKWEMDPILDDSTFDEFDYEADLNERRLRDAEAIGTVARNISPGKCVEIGTALSHSTALIGINSPQSTIYTVNILPAELESGAGGILTTGAYSKEEIGSYYRQKGLRNIQQVFANTATWDPGPEVIEMAFIDGSHDSDFVYNDTLKILKRMKRGSFILWHDFNPDLVLKYPWINAVCTGVERLYRDHHLEGRIYHLRDSWVGIHKVT
jgi:predicted O-methyltransferase YrrM